MNSSAQRAAQDLLTGLKSPRVWLLLAWQDLESRYRRTILGPFWHTALMGAYVLGLTILFSAVRGVRYEGFLLYVTAGFTGWTLVSSIVSDGSTAFNRGESLLKSYDLPASLHVFRCVANQFIMFGHTLIVMAVVLIYTNTPPTLWTLMLVPALVLLFLMGIGMTLIMGLLGARFRDVSLAVGAGLSFMFIMTPIFWRREDLGPNIVWVVDYNPMYHALEIVRRPLMSQPAEMVSWLVCIGIAVGSLVIGTAAFVRYRRVLTYWI